MSAPPPKKRARKAPAAAPALPDAMEELAAVLSFLVPEGVLCTLPTLQQSVRAGAPGGGPLPPDAMHGLLLEGMAPEPPHPLGGLLLSGAYKGDLEQVRRALEGGVPVDYCSEISCNRTALIVAAIAGFAPIVQLLLEAGADRTRVDTAHRLTPLESCRDSRRGEHIEVERLLQLPQAVLIRRRRLQRWRAHARLVQAEAAAAGFLEIYDEVTHRPGHRGFAAARDDFFARAAGAEAGAVSGTSMIGAEEVDGYAELAEVDGYAELADDDYDSDVDR